jgi:RimJ/RimL family protein N-acetyltransferase
MAERDLSRWTARPRPSADVLEGRWCRLERLEAARHADDLFAASTAPGAEERFRYLFDRPPATRADLALWMERAAASEDPRFYAVIDRASGRAEGRQALMRITPEHGVIEIGNILWGPRIARTRVATEALYLSAAYSFDALGYRRFEWKCDALNEPSRRAALRFGFLFEGIFRSHMVVKGRNRDTAWFAITEAEWPRLKAGMEQWLAPANFDAEGRQRQPLGDVIAAAG